MKLLVSWKQKQINRRLQNIYAAIAVFVVPVCIENCKQVKQIDLFAKYFIEIHFLLCGIATFLNIVIIWLIYWM